jgi:hypothetical protein
MLHQLFLTLPTLFANPPQEGGGAASGAMLRSMLLPVAACPGALLQLPLLLWPAF